MRLLQIEPGHHRIDVERHVERLRGFRDLGLTEVALKLHGEPAAAIRTIGEQVVPRLRD